MIAFLIDEDLPRSLCVELRQAGFDAHDSNLIIVESDRLRLRRAASAGR